MARINFELTPYQIVDAFPDEKRILLREMQRVKKEIKWYFDNLERIKEDYVDDFERLFFTMLWDTFKPSKAILYENMWAIKKAYLLREKNKDKENFDISFAKNKPIETLYSFEKVKIYRNKITCLCPFHRERTPSFHIYRRDNHFHCFGCGAHGDAIEFIMKINDCNFISAVKYLGG